MIQVRDVIIVGCLPTIHKVLSFSNSHENSNQIKTRNQNHKIQAIATYTLKNFVFFFLIKNVNEWNMLNQSYITLPLIPMYLKQNRNSLSSGISNMERSEVAAWRAETSYNQPHWLYQKELYSVVGKRDSLP